MNYLVINSENYADIKKITESAKVEIMQRYALDSFDNYKHLDFAIIGQKAVELFCAEYGCHVENQREAPRTDGKTRAVILPCLHPAYYFDARREEGGMTNIYGGGRVDGYFLVEFDGVLFDSYIWDNKGGAVSFYLFNDSTDYRKYLPYNWEEEHPKPNRVGVLTDRKMSDWKNWLLSRKAAADAEKAKREGKTAEFLARVRAINTEGCTEYKITEKSGYFVRNGLRYSYQIDGNGYISEKIGIAYTSGLDCLDKFVLMSTGRY